eukprot:148936_1
MSDTSQEGEDSDFEDDDALPIIIDNGSAFIKCGFGSIVYDAPQAVFPTVIGRPRYHGVMRSFGSFSKDEYVGVEVLGKRDILTMTNPIEYGYVTDWDKMERIWHHAFNQLMVDTEEHPVLLTDKHVKQQKINREKTIQIMFETFNVPKFYISLQSKLCLYAHGITTGIVVDSSYNLTKCVPVYEGHVVKNAIQQTEIGGVDVSKHLKQILINNDSVMQYVKKYISFKTIEAFKTCKGLFYTKMFPDLKQYEIANYTLFGYIRNYTKFDLNTNVIPNDINNLCYKFYNDKEDIFCYQLPDGVELCHIDKKINPKWYFNSYDRTQCVECLFDPSLLSDTIKSSEIGIHELCFNSIKKCDIEQQGQLCKNIVLCGGNSMFEGIDERFIRELKKLQFVNDSYVYKINIISKLERKYLAWIGGSVLASQCLQSFGYNEKWISRDEYNEKGPNIVHQKCYQDH